MLRVGVSLRWSAPIALGLLGTVSYAVETFPDSQGGVVRTPTYGQYMDHLKEISNSTNLLEKAKKDYERKVAKIKNRSSLLYRLRLLAPEYIENQLATQTKNFVVKPAIAKVCKLLKVRDANSRAMQVIVDAPGISNIAKQFMRARRMAGSPFQKVLFGLPQMRGNIILRLLDYKMPNKPIPLSVLCAIMRVVNHGYSATRCVTNICKTVANHEESRRKGYEGVLNPYIDTLQNFNTASHNLSEVFRGKRNNVLDRITSAAEVIDRKQHLLPIFGFVTQALVGLTEGQFKNSITRNLAPTIVNVVEPLSYQNSKVGKYSKLVAPAASMLGNMIK